MSVVRVTVPHRKTKQEVVQSLNESIEKLLTLQVPGGARVTNVQRSWNGNTLHFSLVAGMGFLTAPVRGAIQVTDQDVTIEVDLPNLLTKFIPEQKIASQIETRVKGLLA
jgi:hypothetical protein